MFYNVRDFGALGDGKTNDLFAFQRALEAMRPVVSSSIYDVRGGGVLQVPAGNYFLNGTLVIGHEVQIVGISGNDGKGAQLTFTIDASGVPRPDTVFPGGVSRLMFPRGITGIVIALGGGPSTSGPGEVILNHGAGTTIRNLILMSAGLGDEPAPTSPKLFGHGISVKARAIIENCYIYNFNGNGIHIVAPSAPPLRANAEEFIDLKHPHLGNLYRDNTFEKLEIEDGIQTTVLMQHQANPIDTHVSDTVCRKNGLNGVYIIGSNSGNMLFEKVHCLENRSYGFFDSERSSGNIYIACHSQLNGRGGYYCLSSIASTEAGKLRYAQKFGNSSIYISCYQEQAVGAPTRIYSPAIILGGELSTEALLDPTAKHSLNYTNPDPDLLPANSAEVRRLDNPEAIEFVRPTVITNGTGWPATTTVQNGVRSYGGDIFNPLAKTIAAELGGTREQVALTLYAFRGDTGPYRLHYEGRGAATHEKWWSWILADQTDYESPLSLKAKTNPEPSESNLWLEMGYYVGGITERVLVKTATKKPEFANPADDTYPVGSRVFNSNPKPGGYAGWIKTEDGQWRSYGKIEP